MLAGRAETRAGGAAMLVRTASGGERNPSIPPIVVRTRGSRIQAPQSPMMQSRRFARVTATFSTFGVPANASRPHGALGRLTPWEFAAQTVRKGRP